MKSKPTSFEDCKLRISVKAYINLNIAREEAAAQLRKTFLRQQAAHQSSFEYSLLRISVKDTINLNIAKEGAGAKNAPIKE